MVLLVLWCQKRRYRLHRLSKESSEAEAEGEEGEISGREMDTIPKKETLEPVAEDPPPDYSAGGLGPSADGAVASEPEEIGVKHPGENCCWLAHINVILPGALSSALLF